MSDSAFELVQVPAGALSLRSLEHGETFHPGIGPMEEARILHVAQHRFHQRIQPGTPFVIWDIGLGAAANALAVIEALADAHGDIQLISFDQTLDPLRFALRHADRLGYLVPWKQLITGLLATGHACWRSVAWSVHVGDFRTTVDDIALPAPHAILFDPYSPTSNPTMWTRELFQRLRSRAAAECTFSSYSRSTATRVNLLRVGWCVGRGAATGEKVETTIAATGIQLLDVPLSREWLTRVSRSTAAGLCDPGETSAHVAALLEQHPQFAQAAG